MSPIRYMARNHVAANILMLVLVAGGLLALRGIKVEVFPDIELDFVTVSVAYPGAGPEEVEEGIVRPIEEAVFGLEGVKRVYGGAVEGGGSVTVELLDGVDADLLLQDVKSAVDRIITFPQQAERPVIQKLMRRRSVMTLVVYGDVGRHTLREQAEAVRDELLALPQVTQADLLGIPPYEISIEVSEEALRRHGLTLDRVAAIVRAASVDLPAGAVRARGGEILLRTKERRYFARQYRDVVVLQRPGGELVRLGDIAVVKDTFMETDMSGRLDGKPGAMVEIYRVGDQTPTEISKAVTAYVEQKRTTMPPAMGLAIWNDRSEILASRMNLLVRNAAMGLVLVIVVLGLFLQVRLAFWVTLGIPLSMLGSLMLLPSIDVSVNMLSLFAFILVLGIVVDDAIVVGENVFTHRQAGATPAQASVLGTQEVGRPVTFSILTTVAAFAPLLFVEGVMGKFMRNLPTIVIAVLMISLIESLFVLPAHLAGSKPPDPHARGPLARFHGWFAARVQGFIHGPYERTLRLALRHRYTTLSVAVALVAITVGLFAGKHIKFIFMPELEGNVVHGRVLMPFGTPAEQTDALLQDMLRKAQGVVKHYDATMPANKSIARNIMNVVGTHMGRGGSNDTGGHVGEVAVFLVERDERNVDSQVFANRWREAVGEVPGAEAVEFDATMMDIGSAIDVQLGHEQFEVLEEAAERLKSALTGYPGLFDIKDSQEQGKRELKLKLKPEARSLGITERDLGSQVRSAFYGAEALRLQRGRNEVRVMVRYPLSERRSLADVSDLRVRAAAAAPGVAPVELPLHRAAHVAEGRGYSKIRRVDRKRVLDVTARANLKIANPPEITQDLMNTILPQLQADYPGLTCDMEGQSRHREESLSSMYRGFLVALLVIFALLAIPFRSYAQPLIIMSAIPFGIIGAVGGHLLLGFNVSLMSQAGVVAVTGVVVNDSLVLIDFINRHRRAGDSVVEAVVEGGKRRFRPIILTTLTTFFALVPMLAETSVQARFLVPMAVSLAFGVLFATLITLLLIPALYVILEDLKKVARWWLHGPAGRRG